MAWVVACGTSGDNTLDGSTDALDGAGDQTVDSKPESSTKDVTADVPGDVATDAPSDAIDESAPDAPSDALTDASTDAITGDGGGCSSNTDCASTDYCEKGLGNCGGTGTCMARPKFCPLIYIPVCGCDKTTHTNTCASHRSGWTVAYNGVCE